MAILRIQHIGAAVRDLEHSCAQFFEDTVPGTNNGYEAFIDLDQPPGMTVELIEPHDLSRTRPDVDQPVAYPRNP